MRPSSTAVLSGGRFSPDGRWIAFEEIDNSNATTRVWIVRAEGELPVSRSEWVAVTDGTAVERDPAWSPGGRVLYFLSERDGFRCIWARRMTRSMQPEGSQFAVKHLHSARLSLATVLASSQQIGFWAAPGRLVFSLGELTGNIWLEEKAAVPR
jgi:eukaryotic-like serine/threonine-protein kinase